MKLRILLGSLVFFMVAAACGFNVDLGNKVVTGSGKRTTETRQVSGFDKVLLEGSGEIELQQGDKEALSIEADENVLPLIRSEVVNGRLELGFKPNINISLSTSVVYHLTVKDIHAVTLAGSGKLTSTALKTDNLALSIPGSGEIRITKLDAKQVTPNIAGSGDIVIEDGAADTLNVNLAGSGSLDCGGFKTASVDVTVAGSGNITVWATDSLTGKVLGSGNIRYYGSPAKTEVQTIGSGNIKALGKK
jgi:hypothetical protein